jgi:hypothetical protein
LALPLRGAEALSKRAQRSYNGAEDIGAVRLLILGVALKQPPDTHHSGLLPTSPAVPDQFAGDIQALDTLTERKDT